METPDEALEDFGNLDLCFEKLTALVECLFCTLSATEMVMNEVVAYQAEGLALEERELILIKPADLDISLANLQPTPRKDLLQINLKLIAAMQDSLKNLTRLGRHVEHRNRDLDVVQLMKDLGEGRRQMIYWAIWLEGSSGDGNVTSETQMAVTLNLMRVARTFGMSLMEVHNQNFISINTDDPNKGSHVSTNDMLTDFALAARCRNKINAWRWRP